MSIQIDYNDHRYAQAAAEILRRHDNGEPEANITSAVRDFLIVTGLVRGDEMAEENPPAQGSRRAVDLAALDTFIEFKRRIGTAGGFNPNAEYVQQLDDYLEQSEKQGREFRCTISGYCRTRIYRTATRPTVLNGIVCPGTSQASVPSVRT